jgi:hypothetical protein
MQYDMIWHVNAGMFQICWSIYRMHITGQIGSLINFGQKNTAFQIYFKNSFIFGLGSYFWRKEIKSQETEPESAGEDREVALLRR